MTLEEIHADAVAPAQRPHSPRGEERRSDREDDARELQPVSELDGERHDVGDHERKPYQGRVVLEPPCRPRSKQVPALPADDPQGGRREKDDVSGEEDSDAQRAIVHELILGAGGRAPGWWLGCEGHSINTGVGPCSPPTSSPSGPRRPRTHWKG